MRDVIRSACSALYAAEYHPRAITRTCGIDWSSRVALECLKGPGGTETAAAAAATAQADDGIIVAICLRVCMSVGSQEHSSRNVTRTPRL